MSVNHNREVHQSAMHKTERSLIFLLLVFLIMFICITLSQVFARTIGLPALYGTVFGAAIGGVGFVCLRKLFQRYFYKQPPSEKND